VNWWPDSRCGLDTPWVIRFSGCRTAGVGDE
jgi:hypothetical protein